jgi:membrane protease YdiL (CAAX protease family)
MTKHNFNLLPDSRNYSNLFLPFFLPYAIYICVRSIPPELIPAWSVQLLAFLSVSFVLILLRENYRIESFEMKQLAIALLFTPALLCLWIYPLRFFISILETQKNSPSLSASTVSELYFYLRLINSVFLVALFEEFLCRIYLMQYLFEVSRNTDTPDFVDRIMSPLHARPDKLDRLPFSCFSVLGSTLFFTLGHGTSSYCSAILYFSATNILYWKTESIWTCILTHSFTNLGIALLVKYNGMGFLWS